MAFGSFFHKKGRCLVGHRTLGKVVEVRRDCAAVAVAVVVVAKAVQQKSCRHQEMEVDLAALIREVVNVVDYVAFLRELSLHYCNPQADQLF